MNFFKKIIIVTIFLLTVATGHTVFAANKVLNFTELVIKTNTDGTQFVESVVTTKSNKLTDVTIQGLYALNANNNETLLVYGGALTSSGISSLFQIRPGTRTVIRSHSLSDRITQKGLVYNVYFKDTKSGDVSPSIWITLDSNNKIIKTKQPTPVARSSATPVAQPSATPGVQPPATPGVQPPITPGNNPPSLVTLKNPLKSDLNSIPKIINAILDNIVIPIAVPIFILAIIYTGILYVIARGKPVEITKAHEALKWTLIGGAVILGAKLISTAIAGTLSAITNTVVK